MTESQAKAVTETVKEAQEQNIDALATKADLRNVEFALKRDMENLEASLKRDMEILEAGLKGDMENLETRLTGKITLVQWMLAIVIAAQVLPLLKNFFQ